MVRAMATVSLEVSHEGRRPSTAPEPASCLAQPTPGPDRHATLTGTVWQNVRCRREQGPAQDAACAPTCTMERFMAHLYNDPLHRPQRGVGSAAAQVQRHSVRGMATVSSPRPPEGGRWKVASSPRAG